MSETKIPKPDFVTDEQWAAVLATRSEEGIRAMSREETDRYLATRGGEGGTGEELGGASLLITTIGRKTGKEITTPLNYIEDGNNLVVVGSFAGLPKDPHWWLNLQKNPRAWVQVRDRRWPVTARKATPQERPRLWGRLMQLFPMWGHFQKYCEREFPVVVLTPDEGAA